MPFISFIIPVYNIKRYLPECIESVFSQPFDDWEIILVDDKSEDGSEHLCDRYATEDDRITAIHMPINVGPGLARNEGLRRASGSYVFFMDGDDTIGPGELPRLWGAVARCGSPDIMQVGFLESLGKIHTPRTGARCDFKESVCSIDEFLTPILLNYKRIGFRAWEFLFKRTTLLNAGVEFGSARIWEDNDFTMRGLFAAGNIGEFTGAFYHWRIRQAGSLTAAHDKMWEQTIRSAVAMLEFACKEAASDLHKEWALRSVYSCIVDFEATAGAIPAEDISRKSDLFLPFSSHMQELGKYIEEENLLWFIRKSGARQGVPAFCRQKVRKACMLMDGRAGFDVYGMPATLKCARLLNVLAQNGYTVKGMLDNDTRKQGLILYSNVILSPEIIPLCYDDYTRLHIIVTTSTKKTAIAIGDQLRSYGLEEEKNFVCSWFDD